MYQTLTRTLAMQRGGNKRKGKGKGGSAKANAAANIELERQQAEMEDLTIRYPLHTQYACGFGGFRGQTCTQ